MSSLNSGAEEDKWWEMSRKSHIQSKFNEKYSNFFKAIDAIHQAHNWNHQFAKLTFDVLFIVLTHLHNIKFYRNQ
jgi:hypothetical protein